MSDTAPRLPPERSGRSAPIDLTTRRQGLAAAVAAGYGRTDPPAEEVRLSDVRALRFRPEAASRGTVVHIHGGAFRMGCPEAVAPFAKALSERCGVTVVCPAYRLAPEHPFPAGIVDAHAVLEVLLQDDDGLVILSGDSAGGGIAAAAALLASKRPLAGLILLSAWLDLTVSSDSYVMNAERDPLFSPQAAQEAAELYLQGASPSHPLASPLRAGLTGFPPTFINVGDGEVLLDDSLKLEASLRAAGAPAELQVVAGMDHVAVTRDLAAPGAAETFAALATFVDRIVSGID